jgi:hypothetical protein
MSSCQSVLVPLELEEFEKIQTIRIRTGLRSCDVSSLIIEEALKNSSVMKVVEERAKELAKETH